MKAPEGIDARTDEDAFVDRALESEDGAAEIALGGEASHQRRSGLSCSH
jgi:hypothetical protein